MSIRRRTMTLAAGVALATLATTASAQLTFYQQEGLHGRAFTTNGAVSNFERYGFNDRASSAIVQRGQWEVCEDAGFHGRCVILRPGQYPSLRAMGLDDRVSSARPARGRASVAYAPAPPTPSYGYYPRYGERLYQADVVAVRAVMGPPEQRCWVEQRQVATGGGPNVPGAIVGGILGGVLGHQIGNGRGNDVATAIGAVGGAAIGANAYRGGTTYATQDVQHCTTAPAGRPAYWDVTYDFRGREYRAQLASAPGSTITVNENGEPRA